MASALFILYNAARVFQDGGDNGGGAAAAVGALIGNLCVLVLLVIIIASLWKIFTKAGKPGWAAIVPLYNVWILLEIIGRPGWWIILFLIPLVNIIVAILVYVDLAKSFGKGTGFGLGLIFLSFIFFPILAFGDAKYMGPAAGGAAPTM